MPVECPVSIDEIVQQHIIGKDKLLYRAIKADRLGSIILYGPPGVETTIARVIANTTNSHFCKLNATSAGIKDVEKDNRRTLINQNAYHKGTILFIDEIHRFNKHNKIIFFLMKMVLLFSLELLPKIHILKSIMPYFQDAVSLN